ncbi:MAG TPA: hypothetical protein VND22_04130 [Actinomycetota bacterium]|nr:hypothetical protein [Actinomycetota bacterium]
MRKAIAVAISAAILMGAFIGPVTAKPTTFEASGRFALPNTLAEGHFWVVAVDSSWGITGTEFRRTCTIPASQGLDGYVVELPDNLSTVPVDVNLDVTAGTKFHKTYMIFFDKNCRTVGWNGWNTDDDQGLMPLGTKYVLVTARLGAFFTFDLKATERG